MKVFVELDIKENKVDFIMELLKSFSFVKAKQFSPDKANFLQEFKEAIDELNLITEGKKKARPVKSLLDEL